MTDLPGFRDQPKSMGVFILDNQGTWPEGAEQAGDLVVWPDQGRYPTFVPIAAAKHPNFNGQVVVLAGNRGLVVAFVAGAQDLDDVRAALKSRKGVTQFRVAIDAIIHRLVLHCMGEAGSHDHVHPTTIFSWLATQHRREAEVVAQGLRALSKTPGISQDTFETADRILETLAIAPLLRPAGKGDGQ